MNCRYCGKDVGLLRRWARRDFCSEEHFEAYRREQRVMQMARLLEVEHVFRTGATAPEPPGQPPAATPVHRPSASAGFLVLPPSPQPIEGRTHRLFPVAYPVAPVVPDLALPWRPALSPAGVLDLALEPVFSEAAPVADPRRSAAIIKAAAGHDQPETLASAAVLPELAVSGAHTVLREAPVFEPVLEPVASGAAAAMEAACDFVPLLSEFSLAGAARAPLSPQSAAFVAAVPEALPGASRPAAGSAVWFPSASPELPSLTATRATEMVPAEPIRVLLELCRNSLISVPDLSSEPVEFASRVLKETKQQELQPVTFHLDAMLEQMQPEPEPNFHPVLPKPRALRAELKAAGTVAFPAADLRSHASLALAGGQLQPAPFVADALPALSAATQLRGSELSPLGFPAAEIRKDANEVEISGPALWGGRLGGLVADLARPVASRARLSSSLAPVDFAPALRLDSESVELAIVASPPPARFLKDALSLRNSACAPRAADAEPFACSLAFGCQLAVRTPELEAAAPIPLDESTLAQAPESTVTAEEAVSTEGAPQLPLFSPAAEELVTERLSGVEVHGLDEKAAPIGVDWIPASQPALPEGGLRIRRGSIESWMELGASYMNRVAAIQLPYAPRRDVEARPIPPVLCLPRCELEPIAESRRELMGIRVSQSEARSLFQVIDHEARRAGTWKPLADLHRHLPMLKKAAAITSVAAALFFLGTSDRVAHLVDGEWAQAQQIIQSRAMIHLEDDFRGGLGSWQDGVDINKSWNYEPGGAVRPGDLGVYLPSMSMKDYRLEFTALIERKAVGWVFRAADHENYYAMKLTLLRTSIPQAAAIIRYPVINGKPGPQTQSPIPLYVQQDTQYQVRVDVRGDYFTTSVQGQVVDYWSDPRFTRGGIGFFTDRGERARLLRVSVIHQDDLLGKLCAFFTQNGVSGQDGSANR